MPSTRVAWPASIGPPETKTVGMLRRIAAISMPGVILSQLEMQISASAQCASTMYSTRVGDQVAGGQRVQHAAVAHRDAVVDGDGVELARDAARRADRLGDDPADRLAGGCGPGTNSVKLLATAMIGLPMSAPATPEARIRARAPAMLRPWVTVRDLSSGIVARSFRSTGRAYAEAPDLDLSECVTPVSSESAATRVRHAGRRLAAPGSDGIGSDSAGRASVFGQVPLQRRGHHAR